MIRVNGIEVAKLIDVLSAMYTSFQSGAVTVQYNERTSIYRIYSASFDRKVFIHYMSCLLEINNIEKYDEICKKCIGFGVDEVTDVIIDQDNDYEFTLIFNDMVTISFSKRRSVYRPFRIEFNGSEYFIVCGQWVNSQEVL